MKKDITIRKQRNSTIELLRIFCILMIVFMHLVGIWWNYCDTLFDKEFVILVNSSCNCAVTIFMLISGYYGIRFNLKKIIQFEIMVLFYSILFISLQYSLINGVGAKEMVSSAFPLLTSKYWFYTAYVIIFFVSPYIHQLVNLLSKKQFKTLIGILLFFYVLSPTVIQLGVVNDSGKGVYNMFLVYLIGRYIGIYGMSWLDSITAKRVFWYSIILLVITCLLNNFMVFVNVRIHLVDEWHYLPFARDCSLTQLLLAILVFCYFRKLSPLSSSIINKVSTYCFSLYVISSSMLPFVEHYGGEKLDYFILLMYFFIICFFSLILEFVRRCLLDTVFNKISDWIFRACLRMAEIFF